MTNLNQFIGPLSQPWQRAFHYAQGEALCVQVSENESKDQHYLYDEASNKKRLSEARTKDGPSKKAKKTKQEYKTPLDILDKLRWTTLGSSYFCCFMLHKQNFKYLSSFTNI